MSPRLPAALLALALLAGCATVPSPPTPVVAKPAPAVAVVAANDNLNAVAWSQTAIEHDLIYLQTYRDAQARLLAALHDRHWDALDKGDRTTALKGLKPAVILDIDETVLDNSPFAARMVKSGDEYNEADMGRMVQGGARTRVARRGRVHPVRRQTRHRRCSISPTVRSDLDQATLANLRKVGLPVSGAQSFLGLGTVVEGCEQNGTEKGCRRAAGRPALSRADAVRRPDRRFRRRQCQHGRRSPQGDGRPTCRGSARAGSCCPTPPTARGSRRCSTTTGAPRRPSAASKRSMRCAVNKIRNKTI